MFMTQSAEKENFRFRLDEGAKVKWKQECNRWGMKQQQVVSRLIAWFLDAASDEQKTAILRKPKVTGHIDDRTKTRQTKER